MLTDSYGRTYRIVTRPATGVKRLGVSQPGLSVVLSPVKRDIEVDVNSMLQVSCSQLTGATLHPRVLGSRMQALSTVKGAYTYVSGYLSLSRCLSLSLSRCLCHSVSSSISCLCLSLSRCLCQSVSLPLYLVAASLSRCLSHDLSASISGLCLSLSRCLAVSVSLFLFSLSLSLCLCLSLY